MSMFSVQPSSASNRRTTFVWSAMVAAASARRTAAVVEARAGTLAQPAVGEARSVLPARAVAQGGTREARVAVEKEVPAAGRRRAAAGRAALRGPAARQEAAVPAPIRPTLAPPVARAVHVARSAFARRSTGDSSAAPGARMGTQAARARTRAAPVRPEAAPAAAACRAAFRCPAILPSRREAIAATLAPHEYLRLRWECSPGRAS
jgi:hypothetical protein